MSFWGSWPVVRSGWEWPTDFKNDDGELEWLASKGRGIPRVTWVMFANWPCKEWHWEGNNETQSGGNIWTTPSDWLWWQCRGRIHGRISSVSVRVHKQASLSERKDFTAWTASPVGLFPCSSALSKRSKQIRSMSASPLSIIPEKEYVFLFHDLVQTFHGYSGLSKQNSFPSSTTESLSFVFCSVPFALMSAATHKKKHKFLKLCYLQMALIYEMVS